MSISEKILSLLLEPRFRYKGVSVSAFGLPALSDEDIESIHRTLLRLCKKKYVIKDGKHWKISKEGELHALSLADVKFKHSFNEKQPKNLILMFDIKESLRKERNELRKHLREFCYTMIQKSVWVGPSPLPKEFKEYLIKMGLKESIKTFKLAKGYKV